MASYCVGPMCVTLGARFLGSMSWNFLQCSYWINCMWLELLALSGTFLLGPKSEVNNGVFQGGPPVSICLCLEALTPLVAPWVQTLTEVFWNVNFGFTGLTTGITVNHCLSPMPLSCVRIGCTGLTFVRSACPM